MFIFSEVEEKMFYFIKPVAKQDCVNFCYFKLSFMLTIKDHVFK